MSRIAEAVTALGEEGFTRRMEGIPASERREIFQRLDVPKGGASASARQRNARRIQLAWRHMAATLDEEAADSFARSWLERQGMPMIIEFLDRFGVEHQEGFLKEEAALGELPPDEVSSALEELARKYDPDDVRLYAAVMALPGADRFGTRRSESEGEGP